MFYLIILTADLFSLTYVYLVKFAVIALCALYAVYLLIADPNADRPLFLLIRMLTLAADYLLVICDDHYPWAVGFFVSVEILYGILLNDRHLWGWRFAMTVAAVPLLTIIRRFSLLNLLALINITNLTFNFIDAIDLEKTVWAVGFALFWLCDISVGAYNLFPANQAILYAIWLFYVPSQVILCLGGNIHEEK